VTEPRILLTGLAFGESPRWHQDRLWVSDWGAREVIAVDLDGKRETVVRVSFPAFPMCMDWLPDGERLLIVASRERRVLRREPDGSMVTHADLSDIARGFNEIVVDGRGNAYVNGGNSDLMAGEEFTPGIIALVTPDGSARQVADDIAFGNGMAVTADNSTLIVAESYANRLSAFDIGADGSLSNRRVWAHLGDGVPDGICIDAEGAVWHADVPNKRCVRVREGGEVLQTINLDRGCFACMLGGPEGDKLFLVTNQWRGAQNADQGTRESQVLMVQAPAPSLGWP